MKRLSAAPQEKTGSRADLQTVREKRRFETQRQEAPEAESGPLLSHAEASADD
jgi:hypothetical protein